jgi:DNA-binding response OmpR family regulator
MTLAAKLNLPHNVDRGVLKFKTMKTLLKAAILDDERDLCFLLENILRGQNFETTSFYSIHEASELLTNVHPAVIFLDNQLPDGFGIQFIPRIKAILPETKVVVMTAYNTDGDKSEAIENGADCFLLKPLSKGLIEKTVIGLGLRAAV